MKNLLPLILIILAFSGTSAQSCFESSILSPTPFMGNNGEVFKLADGSFWEVKYEYEYLYEYYPSVVVCPDTGKLIINDVSLNVVKLSGAASSNKLNSPTKIDSEWELYEETNVKGTISGSIKKDTIIEMRSGSIYQVHERVRMRVRERRPEAIVLQDGKYFKLIIDGFDEPLICVQLVEPTSKLSSSSSSTSSISDVIHSNIEDEFEGWEGETIIKLDNGQIWQQTEYYYHYHYSYRPKVIIYNSGYGYKMKVDGVDKSVGVQRLK